MADSFGTERPSPRRGERPRDPSRDEAIRAALLRLLGEVGYGGLTMDALAEKAGVGESGAHHADRGDSGDAGASLRPVAAISAGQAEEGGLCTGRTLHGPWRGAPRGEVPPGLAQSPPAETTTALIVQRWLLTGEPVDEEFADRVLDTLVMPLLHIARRAQP